MKKKQKKKKVMRKENNVARIKYYDNHIIVNYVINSLNEQN